MNKYTIDFFVMSDSVFNCRLAKAKEEENAKVIFDALLNKIPLMLKFLGNEDDDVSGAVGKFSHDWLTLLKTLTPLNDTLKQSVKELLYIVIRKMKYDDSYCFESEVRTLISKVYLY